MASSDQSTPAIAPDGEPEALLRRSCTDHMAAMEAAGWPPAPRWDELSDEMRALWGEMERLRGEDIAAVCREIVG